MIPILAGMAAVGPVANLLTEITHAISQPDAAKFEQSLQNATATASPTQIQMDSILKGRQPSQLSIQEQQSLAQLLVGKTVQLVSSTGEPMQGLISQSQVAGGEIQLQLQGQPVNLNQISSIQVIG